MKNYLLILIVSILILSCSADIDNKPRVLIEIVPVKQVTFPTKYVKDSITEISLKYVLPTDCHSFNGFYYLKEGTVRTVAIEAKKYEPSTNCSVNIGERIDVLKFKPTALGTYRFKFWKNTTSQGIDEFFEFDAVVSR